MKRYINCIFLVICMGLLTLSGCDRSDQPQTVPATSALETVEQILPATTEANEPFELDHEQITLLEVGQCMTLYSGDLETVTWGSEDPAVATVAEGVVTAVDVGSTTVWGEYNGVRASCNVICEIERMQTVPVLTTGSSDSRSPVLQLPEIQNVDSAFFDDAAFVGDSISLKLSNYAEESGALGSATFLVRGSYGVGNEIEADYHIIYQGEEMVIEKALSLCGAKKVFIMLGMNDIALYGVDRTIENWGKMIDNIRAVCPEIQIYIQSMTPVWTGGEKGGLNNDRVDSYNESLAAFAQASECGFIDVAPYMKDSTGGLATVYCSDSYVHLSTEGAKAWIAVLKAFSGYR